MKLGYKIIIGALAVYGFYYYHNNSSEEEQYYIKSINNIINDIRHEDYFALQEKFASNISSKISIRDIKYYIKDFNFTKKSRFVLDDIYKDNNCTKIVGNIVSGNTELPFSGKFIDDNGTLLIKEQIIGTKKLEAAKYGFPISSK